jgi:ABC-type bacteriocin/lantibiotic exporter with double-glycine peptidase domain
MKTEQARGKKSKLSMISALRYFLKGNLIFALNGIIISTIDAVANIFPPLFQQVYTDNIITQKNPEWFSPLLVLYMMLFAIELAAWVAFSIFRRKSQAKFNITTTSNYLWTVLRLPMTLLSQFTPGELVARYTTIPKTIRLMDYSLPIISCLILPAACCYIVMLFNWQLGLLESITM